MEWNIPGTVLMGQKEEDIASKLDAMFLGGGIVLSQVSSITGLEPYTVQNWVKRGFLSPPVKKKYSLHQLCRIININMLKSVLPMEQICGLLTYINGELDDESDDVIDDARLYSMFLRIASHQTGMDGPEGRDRAIARELEGYVEPVPGAKERVEKVLRIMLTAWAAAQLRQLTVRMLEELV